jgi:hypothetical protein
MPGRSLAFFAALALGLIGGGCAGAEDSPSSATRNEGPPRRQASRIETMPARCSVGERPDYFVPGSRDGRLVLLGCARLGVSGKRVEFSGSVEDLDGARHACINPAYSGRGRRGLYIPAICALAPPLSRFAVRDAAQPRQGVHGYALVIWGTAGASSEVVARFAGGSARAIVFKVAPELARTLGESPFSLFVIELPLSAACAAVTVAANGSDAKERIPARTRLCARS